MSISTLESFSSVRALDALHREEEEFAEKVSYLRGAFLKEAAYCQADKFALFAPRVRDFKAGGTRLQTVGELLHGELDYRDFAERAMEVLMKAAAGRGTQREAQQLLEEMAARWADSEASA